MLIAVFWIAVFAVSLYALVKASDYFISYAEKLGRILRMTPFMIGVVLVSVGTAMPEFSTSLASLHIGQGELIFGIMIGTMIANILLLLGLASVLLRKEFLKADWDFTLGDFPALIFTTFLVFLTVRDGTLTWIESLLFLFALVIHFRFLYFVYKRSKENIAVSKEKFSYKMPLFVLLSLVVVIISAKYTINSVVQIATIFGVPASVLTSSVVAVGTSLPELTCILTAVKKKYYDLAFGNAIGATIFGILLVFGVAGFFGTIIVPQVILGLVVPVAIIAVLLFWVIMQDKQITHYEGWLMLIIYAFFILKLYGIV